MNSALRFLVCPRCRGPLAQVPNSLECTVCGAGYPVADGIPDLRGDLDEVKRAQANWFDSQVDPEYEIERPNGTPAFHAWLLSEKFRRSVSALGARLDGAVVACVCAGSGMDAEFLARAGAVVIAFDVSPGAARRAAERARRRRLSIFPVVADAERLPLADRSVEIAFVHDGLHHLERPEVALHEMGRVASTAVSVTEPARALATRVSIRLGYSGDVEEAGNRVERLEPGRVAALLEEAGFVVVGSRRYAMFYRHEAGRPARLLSRPGFFLLGRIGYRLGDRLLGRAGNKLAVQAVRRDTAPRRIVVHDFGGFPFPVQLSRELARRGEKVLHLHCPSYPNGRGRLESSPVDPPGFASETIDIGRPFRKYHPFGRLADELAYGRLLRRRIRAFRPDVVLSDAPLLVQGAARRAAVGSGSAFVFWQQDIHGLAIRHISGRHLPLAGRLAAWFFPRFERRILLGSDAVVPIADAFLPAIEAWGIPSERVSVIENWAPIDELPVMARDNGWRTEHRLGDGVTFLYAGTLGLKHDCDLLLDLARFLGARGAQLVIASEGRGADELALRVRDQPIDSLTLVPFQPFERLPAMLGAADVLVTLLGNDFASLSVPSKVLTYHCAARPLLAAMPLANPASQLIIRAKSGIVVDSDDRDGFLQGALELLEDGAARAEMGLRARSYAEQAFDISDIADRFESVLERAAVARLLG